MVTYSVTLRALEDIHLPGPSLATIQISFASEKSQTVHFRVSRCRDRCRIFMHIISKGWFVVALCVKRQYDIATTCRTTIRWRQDEKTIRRKKVCCVVASDAQK